MVDLYDDEDTIGTEGVTGDLRRLFARIDRIEETLSSRSKKQKVWEKKGGDLKKIKKRIKLLEHNDKSIVEALRCIASQKSHKSPLWERILENSIPRAFDFATDIALERRHRRIRLERNERRALTDGRD